jgi:hypothetical protein
MSEKKNKLTKPKRKAPSTAFKAGNPFAFKPGNNANPSGRSPLETHLLSRHTRAELASRAPADACRAVGLPITSSNGQVLAKLAVYRAIKGDVAYHKLIADLTEPKGGTTVNVGVKIGADGLPLSPQADRMGLVFVSSDGNGNVSEKSLKELADIEAHVVAENARNGLHTTITRRVGSTHFLTRPADHDDEGGGGDGENSPPTISANLLGPE